MQAMDTHSWKLTPAAISASNIKHLFICRYIMEETLVHVERHLLQDVHLNNDTTTSITQQQAKKRPSVLRGSVVRVLIHGINSLHFILDTSLSSDGTTVMMYLSGLENSPIPVDCISNNLNINKNLDNGTSNQELAQFKVKVCLATNNNLQPTVFDMASAINRKNAAQLWIKNYIYKNKMLKDPTDVLLKMMENEEAIMQVASALEPDSDHQSPVLAPAGNNSKPNALISAVKPAKFSLLKTLKKKNQQQEQEPKTL